jgi:hypothetical protein
MAETRHIGLIADRTLEEVRTGHYDAMLSNDRVLREQAETKYEIEQLRLDMQENAAMMKQLVLGRAQRIEEFENRLFLEINIGNNTRQQLLWEVERNTEDRKSRILGMHAAKISSLVSRYAYQIHRTDTAAIRLHRECLRRPNYWAYLSKRRCHTGFKSPARYVLPRVN